MPFDNLVDLKYLPSPPQYDCGACLLDFWALKGSSSVGPDREPLEQFEVARPVHSLLKVAYQRELAGKSLDCKRSFGNTNYWAWYHPAQFHSTMPNATVRTPILRMLSKFSASSHAIRLRGIGYSLNHVLRIVKPKKHRPEHIAVCARGR